MTIEWQSKVKPAILRMRAEIIAKVRNFFRQRGVLEVETPLLSQASVTDVHIHSIACQLSGFTHKDFYLQTSPEFAMKRLLAQGVDDIYQICKAFRNDEIGKLHNPEFTMLEWYRVGFDHLQLMAELDELLQFIADTKPCNKITYRDLFIKYLNLDPLQTSLNELRSCAKLQGIANIIGMTDTNIDAWLNLLLSHCIEPLLASDDKPVMIYNYPATQAGLARADPGDPRVANRFELYWRGIELANGFYELTNANEQRQRFENDLLVRKQKGLPLVSLDERLLAALEHGLPDCAGVALGLDRFIMLIANARGIDEVMSFTIDRA